MLGSLGCTNLMQRVGSRGLRPGKDSGICEGTRVLWSVAKRDMRAKSWITMSESKP